MSHKTASDNTGIAPHGAWLFGDWTKDGGTTCVGAENRPVSGSRLETRDLKVTSCVVNVQIHDGRRVYSFAVRMPNPDAGPESAIKRGQGCFEPG